MVTTRDKSHSLNGAQADPVLPSLDVGKRFQDWGEPESEPRDWKKFFLVLGLGTLSWVATYVGMLELIQANMGQLPLTTKAIIGFSVAMLMTMIIWLLDQLFSPASGSTKIAYGLGYVFLTLISVGFGFGFYWKVLESRSEATRSAESAIGEVQNSLHAASTRLEQLNTTLINLTKLSSEKAILERETGKSCPNSRPGDGPRRKLRDADAQQFKFASNFVASRIGSVKSEMTTLDGDLAKIVSRDESTVDAKTGTRNDYLRALNRRLDLTVTGFNAFRTDPQLRQIRSNLSERSDKTVFPNGRGGTFSCPDMQLQTALRGVVRAIDQLPELGKPKIAAVEGSEATIEAFRRLSATVYGVMTFELPPSADDLRTLQKKAIQSVRPGARSADARASTNGQPTGLAKRDYVPLAIAVFVDLCLLLVSIGRPMNRFMATKRKMMEAEAGPVFPILHRFDAIHKHEDMRATFSIFREVIFDSGGVYHVAVPLNAPQEAPDRDELLQESQKLANLCYALEGQGVLSRPWRFTPMLVAERKLRRQGSKFVTCYPLSSIFDRFDSERERPAFRIYAFKNGAWPELILGAVMGAARRIETEEAISASRRSKTETAQTLNDNVNRTGINPTKHIDKLAIDPDLPEAAPQSLANANWETRSVNTAPSAMNTNRPMTVSESTTSAASSHGNSKPNRDDQIRRRKNPDEKIEPDVKTAYGRYAASAQEEIKEGEFRASIPTLRADDIDEITRARRRRLNNVHLVAPSNSEHISSTNENSSAMRAQSHPSPPFDKPSYGKTTVAGDHNKITNTNGAQSTEPPPLPGNRPGGEIVTFPNAPSSAPDSTLAMQIAKASSHAANLTSSPNSDVPELTDVTLVRETATFSVPTSSAKNPPELSVPNKANPTDEKVSLPPRKKLAQATAKKIAAQRKLVGPNSEHPKNVFKSNNPPTADQTKSPSDQTFDSSFDDEESSIDVGKISVRFAPPAAE